MDTNIIEFTKHNWIWRIQTSSDIVRGDLSNLEISAYYKTVWVDSENNIINEIKAIEPIKINANSSLEVGSVILTIQTYLQSQMTTQEPNY
ncbi:hypothetical protein LC613_28680 [Nostoc sphaeroides CHAB 2801]|uniref:hypothetical protein n=1 Tax=Nostoc sphaeroides TaxID=446679 RepID=UPI000E466A36|nr:hypothetical protein [Nostoc sphaeroides]MCC5631696.1 hypothetical protein [Nostoc sphaeroides CHAB 2801]